MSRSFSVTEMVALVRKHIVYIIHSIYSWDLQLKTVTFLSNRNRIRFRLSRLTRPIIVMITHFEVPASACIWWHTHTHTQTDSHTHKHCWNHKQYRKTDKLLYLENLSPIRSFRRVEADTQRHFCDKWNGLHGWSLLTHNQGVVAKLEGGLLGRDPEV